MKIDLRSDKPLDAIHAETGRSLDEWFALLDAFGGPAKGRREIGNHLLATYRIDPWWVATLNIEYEAHHGLREKDGKPTGYMVCATKSIKAPAQACFDAFASAKALDRWLGSGHVLDFRDGGELRNGDGNLATLRRINPGKTIKLVWQQADAAAGTPVEVKFEPVGAKTTVMVTHDRLQTRADADGLRRAWGGALDRLKGQLES